MNRKILTCGMLISGLLVFQESANASPFQFQFTEAYDSIVNPAIFGTAVNVLVTVDNGTASSASQTYSWNDIVGVSAQAVGGTFFDVWTNIARQTDTATFLTTSASGLSGSLLMGPSGPDEYIVGYSNFRPGYFNQLGSGPQSPIALSYGSDPSAPDTAYIFRDIAATATLVASVPEPETYAMLLAGLGLIGAAVKRRKAKQA